jgi:hypothetical protein
MVDGMARVVTGGDLPRAPRAHSRPGPHPLAYYFEHRDEIKAEIRTDESSAAYLKRQQDSRDAGSTPK